MIREIVKRGNIEGPPLSIPATQNCVACDHSDLGAPTISPATYELMNEKICSQKAQNTK